MTGSGWIGAVGQVSRGRIPAYPEMVVTVASPVTDE